MQPETKVEAADYAALDHPFQRMVVYGAQIVICPILLTMRIFLVRNKLRRDLTSSHIQQHGTDATYVLYANHQSILDPFIICASLPLKVIAQLMPFRFFVENSYFRGAARNVLNVLGGFPAHYEANKSYGLDKARGLLATGQTVVIFPSGTRTREHVAKPGISTLATESNVYLIPIHIDWQHRWHCHVYIGTPLKGGITHPPEYLMQQVYQLPFRARQSSLPQR